MTVESDYTPPHPGCLHPEWWDAPDEQATETEVSWFLGSLVEVLKPRVVVETGTYNADTTVALLEGLNVNRKNGGPMGHLTSIEVDHDRHLACKARLGLRDNLTLVSGSSLEWKPKQEHSYIDLLFSDSGDMVRELEVRHLWPFLHRNSVVAMHDSRYPTIRGQFAALVRDCLVWPPLDLPTPRGLLIARARTTREPRP